MVKTVSEINITMLERILLTVSVQEINSFTGQDNFPVAGSCLFIRSYIKCSKVFIAVSMGEKNLIVFIRSRSSFLHKMLKKF